MPTCAGVWRRLSSHSRPSPASCRKIGIGISFCPVAALRGFSSSRTDLLSHEQRGLGIGKHCGLMTKRMRR